MSSLWGIARSSQYANWRIEKTCRKRTVHWLAIYRARGDRTVANIQAAIIGHRFRCIGLSLSPESERLGSSIWRAGGRGSDLGRSANRGRWGLCLLYRPFLDRTLRPGEQ